MKELTKKMWRFCLILNTLEWVLFLFADYLEEYHGMHDAPWMVILFLLLTTFLGSAVLLIRNRKEIAKNKPWRYPLILSGIWFVVIGACVLLELVFCMLEIEPIRQNTTGWENFLNGIEYALFPFGNAVLGCGLPLLTAFGIVTYGCVKKYKRRRESKKEQP